MREAIIFVFKATTGAAAAAATKVVAMTAAVVQTAAVAMTAVAAEVAVVEVSIMRKYASVGWSFVVKVLRRSALMSEQIWTGIYSLRICLHISADLRRFALAFVDLHRSAQLCTALRRSAQFCLELRRAGQTFADPRTPAQI